MKEFIETIFAKKLQELATVEKCKIEISKLDSLIEAVQEYCPHKHEDGTDAMRFRGNDRHKHFYQCEICKFEMEE
jgi:hypothetical protein